MLLYITQVMYKMLMYITERKCTGGQKEDISDVEEK